MKSRWKWMLVALAFVIFGCAPMTSRALLELSETEGRFYRELHPALIEAQGTFRITSDALVTSTTKRKAAIMRREAAASRQAIYKSVAVPNPPAGAVEKAVEKLASANAAIQAKTDKQKEAAQVRIQAILETFEALDTTLGAIRENQQAIHGYLRVRRRVFGGPGRSALLPYKSFAELRDYLSETVDDLKEQFKLAKELVDAAKKEFDEQEKKPGP